MALTPEDLLPTPAGYATPDQLSSVQQMSKLLMQNSAGNQPITNKWQGPKLLADRATAMALMNRAGQQQQQGLDAFSNQLAMPPPGSARGMGAPPGIEQSSDLKLPQPGATSPPSTLKMTGMDPYDARTAQIESGGNPKAVTGHQYGLMQMGIPEQQKYHITNWQDPNQQIAALHQERAANRSALTQALGRPPTPGEEYLAHQQGLGGAIALLKNPNTPAWQAIRGYYGSDAVAQKAIAGNPPGGGHFDPNAPAGVFTKGWINQFESRMPRGPGQAPQPGIAGQTADASGAVGGASPPPAGSPAAMSGVLAQASPQGQQPQGPQVAAGPKAAPQLGPGMPTVGAPQMGPQFMSPRPQISRQQMFEIMRNPWGDPALKQQLYQQYMEQNYPVTAPGKGGNWIMTRDGQMTFVPAPQMLKEGEFTVPSEYGPEGGLHVNPPQGGVSSGGTPEQPPPILKKLAPAAPTPTPGKPQGALPAPAGGPAAAQAGGGAPAPSMLSAGAMPPGAKPIQLASLDPGIPSPTGAPKAGPQPNVGPQQATPQQATSPTGPQVAQSSGQIPSGPLGPFIDQLKQWDIDTKAAQKGAEEQQSGFAKSSEEERVGINEAAKSSNSQMSQLQTARKLVDDPNFVAGIFNTPGTLYEKAKALISNNPNAAKSIEAFDKIMAGATMPEVRSQTKGTGQVRVAEFNAVKESLASRNLTPAGIKAVLDIMMSAHQQNIDVSDLASEFSKGWRVRPDGTPYKTNRQGLNDPEWQTTLNRFLEQNPVITPERRANWEREFGSNLDEAAARWEAEHQAQSSGVGTQSTGRPQPQSPRTGRPQPQAPRVTVPAPPPGYGP